MRVWAASRCCYSCCSHVGPCGQDPGEHVDLKSKNASIFAALKAKLLSAVGSMPWPGEVVGAGTEAEAAMGATSVSSAAACTAMETKYRGFFGPYDGRSPGEAQVVCCRSVA